MTRDQLEARLAVLMGGRAAEQVVYGHLSTGAADDLAKATELARAMATRHGMVAELGAMSYEAGAEPFPGAESARRDHSPETAREIDRAVREILGRAQGRARAILERNRAVLDDGARALLAQETLDAADLGPLRARLQSAEPVTATPGSRAA